MTFRFRIAVFVMSIATVLALTHVCLVYASRVAEKICHREAQRACGEQTAVVEYSGNAFNSRCLSTCTSNDVFELGSR